MGLNFSKVKFGALCLSSVSVKFSMDQGPGLLRACVSVAAVTVCFIKLGSLQHYKCILWFRKGQLQSECYEDKDKVAIEPAFSGDFQG